MALADILASERSGAGGAVSMRDALDSAAQGRADIRVAVELGAQEIAERQAVYREFVSSWGKMDHDELVEMLARGETIVHIPARAGSTRIKDKNIALLGGHPLLAYPVVQGLGLPGVDRVLVNTDSQEYAAIAQRYGAMVPYLRPTEMASIVSPVFDSLFLLLAYLYTEYGVIMKRLVTMLATNPFRSRKMLLAMLDSLERCSHCTTYQLVGLDLGKLCYEDDGTMYTMDQRVNGSCQLNKSFKMTGHVQGRDDLAKIVQGRSTYLYQLAHPCELVDIDTEEDMELANRIIENGLYDFEGM